MTRFDWLKAAALLLAAAVLQVSVFSAFQVGDARPDVVLVLLVAIALLRGPVVGAVGGFWAGIVLDVALFETLGLTSLLLVLAGYWTGRFGDATTRASAHPPLVAVALATVGVGIGSALVHFMLGSGVPAGHLIVAVLIPGLALNLLLAYPLYRFALRVFRTPAGGRPREVGVVV